MGCGGSTNSEKGQNNEDAHKKGTAFQRQPKVSIKVGNEVKLTEKQPRVIFVFGKINIFNFIIRTSTSY